MDNETYNAIHNDIFEAFEAAFKMGQSVAKENFSDIEKALCRGKRTAIEGFIDWLSVCIKTARKDMQNKVDINLIMNTTLNAMEAMRDEYKEKLLSAPMLISRGIEMKDDPVPVEIARKTAKAKKDGNRKK